MSIAKKKQGFMSSKSKPTFFHYLLFNLFVNESTLFCSIDDIHTLADVNIIDSTLTDLVSWAGFSPGVAAIVPA